MKEIKLSEIREMWGTNDERIGILLDNEEVYFTREVKIYYQYLVGEFSKN